MKRLIMMVVLTVAGLGALPSKAEAGNYIIYLQGRSWGSWNGEVAYTGWTNVTLNYDGNAKLDSSVTNVTVKNTIASYCSGGNNCVINCYSAGCLRMVKAVSDLRASGNTLPGLFWAEATAGASGGTKIAELSTSGWTKFIAKLLGQQEKIDFDLTPGAARGTWGYVQDDMGATVYHIAGSKNTCKKLWFVKICGNKYVDAGIGDGVVGMDSASGASLQGKYWDGCAVAKYPYRTYDSYYSPCGGDDRDHAGMPGKAATILSSCLGGSSGDANRTWTDVSTQAECAASSCDDGFESVAQDFSMTPGLVPIATSVDSKASNTTGSTAGATCAGKCGGYAGACWCDAACVGIGDCCGDYTASRCDIVNSQ